MPGQCRRSRRKAEVLDHYVPPVDHDARVYSGSINLRQDIKVANAPLYTP
jgi:hypothetical protein